MERIAKAAGGLDLSEAGAAFERGQRALQSAERLLAAGDIPAAANRIYTAGENFAYALLTALAGSLPKDHGKIWNAIQDLHTRGVLSANYRSLLETSYRLRMKADYGRETGGAVVVISREILQEHIRQLHKFASEVLRILEGKPERANSDHSNI